MKRPAGRDGATADTLQRRVTECHQSVVADVGMLGR
jgi:hypothetical protein